MALSSLLYHLDGASTVQHECVEELHLFGRVAFSRFLASRKLMDGKPRGVDALKALAMHFAVICYIQHEVLALWCVYVTGSTHHVGSNRVYSAKIAESGSDQRTA
ncbi:hypothetical protein Naga_101577g2 [Nannochloropsis gaditana]|uniref:Uncharacterized protein n=1 Tax=Nannochloropsis gaditana TaxID=72520 RepID=W7TP54_9STRA|nr:hypothetical protein Naga_101577g2 [Nannochloropsis gaditana]